MVKSPRPRDVGEPTIHDRPGKIDLDPICGKTHNAARSRSWTSRPGSEGGSVPLGSGSGCGFQQNWNTPWQPGWLTGKSGVGATCKGVRLRSRRILAVMRCPTILAALAAVLVLAARPTPAGAQSTTLVLHAKLYADGPRRRNSCRQCRRHPDPPAPVYLRSQPDGSHRRPAQSVQPAEFPQPAVDPDGRERLQPVLCRRAQERRLAVCDLVCRSSHRRGTFSRPPWTSTRPCSQIPRPLSPKPPPRAPTSRPSRSSPLPAVQTGTPPSTSSQTTDTPEPLSLLLWSALTGVGLWYARRLRPAPALAS